MICERCGKRYLGMVAHGRSRPYRYYTCYTRHRYGTPACAADRLAADQLDQAVLQALVATYEETDLFERAISAARSQAATLREQHQGELSAVGGKIGKAEAAIDRYLDAFEAGALREQQCARRIEALTAKLVELKPARTSCATCWTPITIRRPTRKRWPTSWSRSARRSSTGRCRCARPWLTRWSRRSACRAAITSCRCSGYRTATTGLMARFAQG